MTLPIRPALVVHHMGSLDGESAPRNSLDIIRASLEAGAAFIEIDVTALADSDYLLVHDPLLEAETTGSGFVAQCTAAQARDLYFRQEEQSTSFPVPLLSQVVDLFKDYAYTAPRLQIDFKNMIPFSTEEPLRRLLNLIKPLGERVIVSTGADWQLRRLRALASWLDLGLDIHTYVDWRPADEPKLFPRYHGAYGYWDDHPLASQRLMPTADYLMDRCASFVGLVPGLSTFYVSHSLLTQSLDDGFNWAAALHTWGIKLDAWTLDVTNPRALTNARRLLAAGVDQFTTNTPLALGALLADWSARTD